MFVTESKIYDVSEIEDFTYNALNDAEYKRDNKGVGYVNVPCAFDIETTSFYRDEHGNQYDYAEYAKAVENGTDATFEKLNTMYVWQLGINGHVMIGRTWDEFEHVMSEISRLANLDENHRLVIYVHNLSYEFQYIRKRFEWTRFFALDMRKPIEVCSSLGIDFRCSYLLSGYSLATLGTQLNKYHVEKLVGELDYSLLRHSETPLTKEELAYCENDVRVVMAYIQEKIEKDGDITQIPLTKTGYVRRYCRSMCLNPNGGKRKNYMYTELMRDLQLNDLNEFYRLNRAFMGGFTHASHLYSRQTLEHVASYDFTSSYPYVMTTQKFPMSHGEVVEIDSDEDFDYCLNNFCCVFDLTLYNVMPKIQYEHYLSSSKCFELDNPVLDNGRVVMADKLTTTITELDFDIINSFYRYDEFQVRNLTIYKKDYLPTEFVLSILELYKQKTTLKGVVGREYDYLMGKERVNAAYGMMVTNPIRDEYLFDDYEWSKTDMTEEKAWELLGKYNRNRGRFLFYPWGIYVTAWARHNLLMGIKAIGEDYVYSDTDSIKLLHHKEHEEYFKGYDKHVEKQIQLACEHHKIPFEMYEPKNVKGDKKRIGIWDYEGEYDFFKTIGAKRYMVCKPHALFANGEEYNISITVSGLNKTVAVPYLVETYGNEVFDMFDDDLSVPADKTGKLLHTYIDRDTSGVLIDYRGKTAKWSEKGSIHLEPSGYEMNLSMQYLDYLKGRRTM